MKFITNIFASTRTMFVLLIIFAISIGWATFIERDYGTDAARCQVYNSKWFEALLLIGLINIISVSVKFKMYRKEKLTLFLFHIAFAIIIIGAGITRYIGKEGTMSIREGQTNNTWYTSKNYIDIRIEGKNSVITKSFPVLFSYVTANKFKKSVRIDNQKISIKLKKFIPKAAQTLVNDKNGQPFIHLVKSGENGREDIILQPGKISSLNNTPLLFVVSDSTAADSAIYITVNGNGIVKFMAPFVVTKSSMAKQVSDSLKAANWHPLEPMALYHFNGVPVIFKGFLPSASIAAQSIDDMNVDLPSALIMELTCNNATREVIVWGNSENMNKSAEVEINGIKATLSYGAIVNHLPFEIKLNDFILKRYPGSESPSWYESAVTLIDHGRGINSEHRIYMNNILKHRGYRFYQASYDMDEKGTILTVNNDGLGTTVTYLGYLLMAVGMALSLINRNSRFRSGKIQETGSKAILTLIVVGLSCLSISSFGQGTIHSASLGLPVVNKDHARLFGHILVQDNGGRIEPFNTLSSEVLRKVARKDRYKGQTSEQVLLGMMAFPERWQHETMIKIGNEQLRKMMGLTSKYASFNDLFKSDTYGGYLLKPYVEDAYRKKPVYRSKFDNEVIRIDERINICYLVYTGSLLRIFPDPADSLSKKWYSSVNASEVFKGDDSVFTSLVLAYYLEEINKSVTTNDWQMPGKLLKSISTFQYKYGKDIMPGTFKVKSEYYYNQSNIFDRLVNIYLIVGIILLLLQFTNIFLPKFKIRYFTIGATVLILVVFLLHSTGLALRWYIAGHAPWSNGYEALVFIAWATILAGLIFARKSGITISATAILAALTLQIAHLSWMDPQVTNLVPVLKSYWLVVHVAVITASYGFVGLGALLALINLLFMAFENKKNRSRLEDQIITITNVIEKTLIAGLYLLAIGSFLGGVWANESWGRYWGWDPKETWALITIIVYAVILHVRLVPALKGRVLFNILSLMGFASVLMTYFGVNYYLSGLHSYAKGEPVPVPSIVYYSIMFVVILCAFAVYSQYRIRKETREEVTA